MRSFSLTLGAVAMMLIPIAPLAAASSAPVDLYVRDVRVLPFIGGGGPIDGYPLAFSATIGDAVNATMDRPIVVEFRLDGNVDGRQVMPAKDGIWNATVYDWSRSINGTGDHTLEVIVDADGNYTDADASNNAMTMSFHVYPAPDVALKITKLARVPMPTEAGDVRHPMGRFEADIDLTNRVIGPAWCDVSLDIRAGGNGTSGVGSTFVTGGATLLGVGEPATLRFVFDTPGVIGDFTLDARAFCIGDQDPANDNDSASSFNLVGGEGGVVAPDGAMRAEDPITATGPFLPRDPVGTIGSIVVGGERTVTSEVGAAEASVAAAENGALSTLARLPGIAENTTHSVERDADAVPGEIANGTGAAQNDSASLLAAAQGEASNASEGAQEAPGVVAGAIANDSAAAQAIVAAQIDSIENTTAPEGSPSNVALAIAHTEVCGFQTPCEETSGDPGLGNVRPCAPQEPIANNGLPQWALWYGVNAYDRGDLFVPSHPPALVPFWPLFDIPLPATGPQLCLDRWAQLAAADEGSPT